MSSLEESLERVRRRVAEAAERSGRSASAVTIVAVSKTVPAERILEAYHLGQRDFGENRVQEARDKREALALVEPMPDARWHLVGHLQTNKAKPAVGLFDIIQSVDSVRLAEILDRESAARGRRLPILLQVDYTSESQRSGFEPGELEMAAEKLVALPHLEILGLMTVAPLGLEGEGLRDIFGRMRSQRARLAELYPDAEWRHLSMGMTDDFEVAIEEGATVVRIGRAIFGDRPRD